jgi:hypothetical protein
MIINSDDEIYNLMVQVAIDVTFYLPPVKEGPQPGKKKDNFSSGYYQFS